MASVKFEKGSKEWYMFQEYWKLCQRFWVPEDSKQYWNALVEEMDSFYKKYKDIALSEKIAAAFINLLDEQQKQNNKSKE